MSRVITVTPDELDKTATDIRGLADGYKTLYEKFYSETNALAETWSGKDNIAFISQIAEFQDDFKKMYDLMYQYADFLNTSATTYRTTQENVETQAKKLVN